MIEERILKWLRKYGIYASYMSRTHSIHYFSSHPASQKFINEIKEEFEFDIKHIRYNYKNCTYIISLN